MDIPLRLPGTGNGLPLGSVILRESPDEHVMVSGPRWLSGTFLPAIKLIQSSSFPNLS